MDRKYSKFNYPNAVSGSKTLLTGIRGDRKQLYITGFYEPPVGNTISFLYKGNISGNIGIFSNNSYNILNYPSSKGVTVVATNLYGPDILHRNCIRVVGNYTTLESGKSAIGCIYEGSLDGSGTWKTLTPSDDTLNTIVHSNSGGLAVGNYDTQLNEGKAFIYDIKTGKYYNIIKPRALSITAYGIWHNGGNSYTICGGYSSVNSSSGLDIAYLVDWNNETHEFTNWQDYQYNRSLVTHFNGITSDNCGGYNLTGDAVITDPSKPEGNEIAFCAHVKRFYNSNFTDARWQEIKFPKSKSTSGNSIYENIVIGVYSVNEEDTINGYISDIV